MLESLADSMPRLYARRFGMLAIYFFAGFACGFYQNSFAPVQDIIAALFHVPADVVHWLALVVPVGSVGLAFACIRFYLTHDLRQGMLLAGAFLLVSGWVRYGAAMLPLSAGDAPCTTAAALLLFGQALMAVGMPFILAAAPLLSDSWFSPDGRALATAVGGLNATIGSVVASVVCPAFFSPANTARDVIDTRAAREANHSAFARLMLAEAALATAAAASLLLLRSRPPTPPCHRAADATACAAGGPPSLTRTARAAAGNAQFWLLFLLFAGGYGAINATNTLLNQVLVPLGYSVSAVGNIGSAVGAGVLGAFLFGALADATRRFRPIVKGCMGVVLAAYLWFALQLYAGVEPRAAQGSRAEDAGSGEQGGGAPPDNSSLLAASMALLGFFGVPVIPLAIELGVETLYPASPEVVGALLWPAGNVASAVLVELGTALQQCDAPAHAPCANPFAMRRWVWAATGTLCVGCVAGLAFSGRYKRQEHEQAARSLVGDREAALLGAAA